MKKLRDIKPPRGYNPKTQKMIGYMAGQLDEQLQLLVERTKDLTVSQLEWQFRPGMNTIGMLMAHLAVVDIWWVTIAVTGAEWNKASDDLLMKYIGIRGDDDGMPIPKDGIHPTVLQGKSAADYHNLLKKARTRTHKELKTWTDRDLPRAFSRGKGKVTKSWVLYHVLEHFAAHLGQILLIKHLMVDAGLLAPPQPK